MTNMRRRPAAGLQPAAAKSSARAGSEQAVEPCWSCKPTLFNWQSMRPHAELHQQPQSGNGHWDLKIWHSLQLTGAQKPSKVCAELGPLGGSCSWGDIQTTPNLFELTLHVRLKPEGVQALHARRRTGETMPRRLYCLTMPPAQLSHEGCCWASGTLS